jgi:endonuclease YncB( thermonuclease family)
MIISLFILLLLPLNLLGDDYGNVTAIYIHNYDGDTITVSIPGYPDIIGKHINVRVNGIDTPELKGDTKELARNAKRFVEHYCKNAQTLELRSMKRDKYFRILADIYVDGVNLGDLLLKNGLAKPYNGGKKPGWTLAYYLRMVGKTSSNTHFLNSFAEAKVEPKIRA